MAKNLMIQGTMSNAGKSLLTAGILRILKQDGYQVAPFKSQNMALNSFITADGLEMGRAQVMQAEAAGIEPDVRMNPILLKPTSDVGSQVIVNGIAQGNQKAKEYFAKKKELIPTILSAYRELEKMADIIVIEGAGSPAEINLKQNDIVNMGLAKMVDAPVLLVGDIDRGGVFAQLFGTVMLLEPEERMRIKGLMINKFRGDKTILDPGVEQIEQLCKIPMVGVIPYMNVDIEDEDSLSERLTKKTNKAAALNVVVIRLPHISNFTDFNPLERIECINLNYITKVSEFGHPDLVILPGTKNTISDLKWLRQNGMEAMIKKYYHSGGNIFGICGGFQMMGQELSDPFGVEEMGTIDGIGLFPMRTIMEKEKVCTRVSGVVQMTCMEGAFQRLKGTRFSGYEIHMGRSMWLEKETKLKNNFSLLKDQNGQKKQDGYIRKNIIGTYVHGIFEKGNFAEQLIELLLEQKGIDRREQITSFYDYKEKQYNLLADIIRNNINMDLLYKIIGISK